MTDLTTRPQTEVDLPLSDSERQERDRLDQVMDSNEESFIAYIRAIKQYRDQRLYRASFQNFDAYLASRRKKYSRQRVSQLIAHVEVIDVLAEQPNVEILPESERQTRVLRTLTNPIEQAAAWRGAQVASGEDQPDSTWVKGGVETIQQIKDTGGYVDTGNGRQTAFAAAITQATAEKKDAQRAHMKRKPPVAVVEGVFSSRGEDTTTQDYVTFRIQGLTDEIWQKLSTGEILRGVFYPVVQEGED